MSRSEAVSIPRVTPVTPRRESRGGKDRGCTEATAGTARRRLQGIYRPQRSHHERGGLERVLD